MIDWVDTSLTCVRRQAPNESCPVPELTDTIYICTDSSFQLHVIASERNLEMKCQVTYCS
jgi:hypothetical protein